MTHDFPPTPDIGSTPVCLSISAPKTSASPLDGEKISFTGTLASMTHQQAHELVIAHGGEPSHHLTKASTILVIGEEGWPLEENGQPSVKLQQAIALRAQGQQIRLIKESIWLSLLGIDHPHADIKRDYTPSTLSRLLGVTVWQIRQWERAGLITPSHRVFRLPYFSFHEVTKARKIADLVKSGIPTSQIALGLKSLNKIYTTLDLQSDVDVVRIDQRLFAKDRISLVELKSRQRFFNFDEQSVTPPIEPNDDDEVLSFPSPFFTTPTTHSTPAPLPARVIPDWHIEGCRLLEDGLLEDAVLAFRQALQLKPDDVEAHFSLADTLCRLGKREAAIERFHCVIEHDPRFLEAWTQMGCLLAELKQHDAALKAFSTAIELHDDYADAHLHKADVLHQLGEHRQAAAHWKRYLNIDPEGPWANFVRQQLDTNLNL